MKIGWTTGRNGRPAGLTGLICGFFLAAGLAARAEPAVLSAGEAERGAAPEASSPRLRDPFWPVGYVPPEMNPPGAAEEAADARPDLVWPSLSVRGRSRAPDGTARVLVDGFGIAGENDVVSIRSRGTWFHWRILSIDEKGVQSRRLGASEKRYKPRNVPPQNSASSASRKEKTP